MPSDWTKYYEKEHTIYPPSRELNMREVRLWEFVRTLLPAEPVQSLLDAGCGNGHLTNKFAELGIARVKGIDVSAFRIQFAKATSSLCIFESGSITATQERDNSFDLVSAIEVLEHMEDLHTSIEELKRITKKWLLITVPYEQEIPIVLCPHCLNHFNYDGHLHSFTAADITKLMTQHGLQIQKIEFFSGWKPSWKSLLVRMKMPSQVIAAVQKMLVKSKLTQMPKPLWMGVLALKAE